MIEFLLLVLGSMFLLGLIVAGVLEGFELVGQWIADGLSILGGD